MELIPLTARMIMTHLVNHLGHHPLSGGPALLHSLINENHDNPYVESSELSSEVFKSPNLQLFVFNDSTLVSYLQIPAESSAAVPGINSHTRDHSLPSSEVRVIVRDISGKYSWDGGVLYRTFEGQIPHGGGGGGGDDPADHANIFPLSTKQTSRGTSPWMSETGEEVGEEEDEGVDVLDQLLEELGLTSPECLPQPRLKLTQPAPSPLGMNLEQETAIMEAIQRQTLQEEEELSRRKCGDPSIRAARQKEPTYQEPKAPFYFCRLLLNDLGMNSWDRRYCKTVL